MATEVTTIAGAAEEPKTKGAARYLPAIARILMGLIFFVFGLNGLFLFLHPPANSMPAPALDFNLAMAKTGYMIRLVAATEILAGALFLLNRFVPLALAIIAPVIVNIIFFHAFLDLPGLAGPAILVLALEIYLAWVYREAFRPMLAAKAQTR